MKLEEINPKALPPMQRKLNRELMVGFINAGLVQRAHLDVRDSIVLYDADKDFNCATSELPDEETQAHLTGLGILYWSKGV
ncbi:hypothetical protein SEA_BRUTONGASTER_149 [Gordonia phage BrutonGaster]|uniref:Uncharacterized protein n=1 Tax=Gordonia phage BrutonGaster TaxID=2530116 RepID=A0A482JKP6_9CAUD|nr:hypothetical protein HOV26_gp033 [Gordonia phage BrutonGaster]QBP33363.1 hypothetical protein SEA_BRUTONGASTER_149 [Gordonia phage BrutonGaster]